MSTYVFFESFIVLVLTFRFMTYFGLIFLYGFRQRVLIHSVAFRYLAIPESFVEKSFLSPLNYFGMLVENEWTVSVKIYFWVLISSLLIYLYASVYLYASTMLS